MIIFPKGSFTGNYQPRGDVNEVDCLIGSEFGYRHDEPGLSNEALAAYIAENHGDSGIDIYLPSKIADALTQIPGAPTPTEVYEGGRTNYFGTKGIATAGELDLALGFMKKYNRNKPMMIAHNHHVGRVALEFIVKGANPIVPRGLPGTFDPKSVQSWTRDPIQWAIREAQVVPYMHAKGQI